MRLGEDIQRDPRIHQTSALKSHKIFRRTFKNILNKNVPFPELFYIHPAKN